MKKRVILIGLIVLGIIMIFSILIIFAYYLIRALSISFGEAGSLIPVLAAFMPNIILTIVGIGLYYRKVYTIC